MAIEITKDNYKQLEKENKILVIDFYADWCGPCKNYAPIIQSLSEEKLEEVLVVKCDVDANPSIAMEYGIRNIPAVMFVKDGELVDRKIGISTKSELLERINKLL